MCVGAYISSAVLLGFRVHKIIPCLRRVKLESAYLPLLIFLTLQDIFQMVSHKIEKQQQK